MNGQLDPCIDSKVRAIGPLVVFPDGSATWVPPDESEENPPESTSTPEPGAPTYHVHHYHHYPDRLTGWQFWAMGGSIALLLSLIYLLVRTPASDRINSPSAACIQPNACRVSP